MGRIANLLERVSGMSNRAGLEVSFRRIRRSSKGRRVIYFLHIGKAAGSQVKQAMNQINKQRGETRLYPLRHEVQLVQLPEESDYFFSIRLPHSRFRSGFYSRKRMGRPLNDIPWTAAETQAFTTFEHANDLAEALFEPGELGMKALAATKSIMHTGMDQIDWFVLDADIFSHRPPIWVLRQEHFDEDFATFLARAGIDYQPQIKSDKRGAHANDYSGIPPLSEKAMDNLRRWYAQDYAFYDAVECWMERERG